MVYKWWKEHLCVCISISWAAEKLFLRLMAADGSHAYFDNLHGLLNILFHVHHTIHTCTGSICKVQENAPVTVSQISLCVCHSMLCQSHTISCSGKTYTICYAISINKQFKSTNSLPCILSVSVRCFAKNIVPTNNEMEIGWFKQTMCLLDTATSIQWIMAKDNIATVRHLPCDIFYVSNGRSAAQWKEI